MKFNNLLMVIIVLILSIGSVSAMDIDDVDVDHQNIVDDSIVDDVLLNDLKKSIVFEKSNEVSISNSINNQVDNDILAVDGDSTADSNASDEDNDAEKIDPTMNILINNKNITVVLPNNAQGVVEFTFNNSNNISEFLVDGSATISIPNLDAGIYNVSVFYKGDDTYNPVENFTTLIITDMYKIISNDIVMYYHDGSKLNIILYNGTKVLSNQEVTITINGVTYNKTTDEDGKAYLDINLRSGIYNAIVSYQNITVNPTVTVKSTIVSENLVKYYGDDINYYVQILNHEGVSLEDVYVDFNVNGVFYNGTTDDDGYCILNTEFGPGQYIVTSTNYITGETYSNFIDVFAPIDEIDEDKLSDIKNNHIVSDNAPLNHESTNDNITLSSDNLLMFYKDGSKLTVSLYNKTTPLANKVISITINGITYNKTTDENGMVFLDINLRSGVYETTITYEDLIITPTVIVQSTIFGEDIVNNYNTQDKYKVLLLNNEGSLLTNSDVTFNINGIFYSLGTDSEGYCIFDAVFGPGEYIVTTFNSVTEESHSNLIYIFLDDD